MSWFRERRRAATARALCVLRCERLFALALLFALSTIASAARLVGTRATETAPAKTWPSIDTVVVPPYLDIVVFEIFRGSARTSVEIFPPRSTTPIRSGSEGIESIFLGDVLATLAVPRPPPGEWIIRKSDPNARVRILSQQFFPRGVLVHPGQGERLRQCDRVRLAYRVLDATGGPINALRDYPVSVELILIRPDGATVTVPLERDATVGAAGFRNTSDFVCTLAGRYWTDVRITTTDARRRRLEIFRDRWSGFSVARSERTHCRTEARSVQIRAFSATLPWIAAPLVVGALAIAAWKRASKS